MIILVHRGSHSPRARERRWDREVSVRLRWSTARKW